MKFWHRIPRGLRKGFVLVAFASYALLNATVSSAQSDNSPHIPQWALTVHDLAMKVRDTGKQSEPPGVFPRMIPRSVFNVDPDGVVETYNSSAPTNTAQNAFFQSLGTNGRACVTCHEPRSGWTVSAASVQKRFDVSGGDDPIFRLVDGATCPTDDVSTIAAKRSAYQLLLSKGVIRIFLPIPAHQANSAPTDYQITGLSDPYACTNLSATPPIVSVYRRPLLSANLHFLTGCPPGDASCAPLSIMWDGREPSLDSQAVDATLGHEQAETPPTDDQIAQIVNFESGIFDAQISDSRAGRLDAQGANGGPAFLSRQNFYIGINDVLGNDPENPGVFTPNVFTLYDAWQKITVNNGNDAARASIARGEVLFNTRQFTIDGVGGLNRFPFDPLGANPIANGTCSVCHDTPNVGNHSVNLAANIGVSDASPPALDVSGLPVFTIACTDTSGPLQGVVFHVTDPGRALLTGNCADVGKFKGPILHALAARAPYFHNGAGTTLDDVVNFYDQRFNIGLTNQEKADLVAFLNSL